MTDPLKQSLRGGRYAVARVLGEGSQATTFEAVDKKDGVLVAIKRFRVRGASSWKEVELAEREARVLAALSRGAREGGEAKGRAMPRSLPRYIDHFEEDGELYLVTEMIEGESLLALRKRGVTFGERDVIRLLREASVAFDFLHGRSPPVIHRDIKPSNVLRRPDGSFAFIDFGSVRDRLKPEGGSTVVGTFGYMAPEQFQGRAMPVTDVYALGATALAMLTGEEPERLPHKGLAIDVQAALGRSRTNPALLAALAAMLEPDPDKRAARVEPLLAGFAKEPVGEVKAPTSDGARGEKRERDERGPGKRKEKGKGKREERRSAREARKEEQRAEREAKRAAAFDRRMMQRSGPAIPPPLVPLLLIGLTLGQVAVTLALGVFVPTLFGVLSVVFGKGMREAGRTTRDAGKVAVLAMGKAKEQIARGRAWGNDEIGVRPVEAEAAPGQRVRVEGAGFTSEVDRAAEELRQAAEEEQAAQEEAEAAREAEREERRSRGRSR